MAVLRALPHLYDQAPVVGAGDLLAIAEADEILPV